jgi:hypothetical protein
MKKTTGIYGATNDGMQSTSVPFLNGKVSGTT